MAGRILLITDGPAAVTYTPALLQKLREDGFTVQVAPTAYDGVSALAFISELALSAMSGHPCLAIDKLNLETLKKAEAIVLAPLTTMVMDIFLLGKAYALLKEAARPVIVVPATMLNAEQGNNATRYDSALAGLPRGSRILWAKENEKLSLGAMGELAIASVITVNEAVYAALETPRLAGKHVLITAGPTVEDFDPVRFISNRSTGRMGVALALAACRAGACVTLVHGPLAIAIPRVLGLSCVSVRSAQEMYDAVMAKHSEADIAILCAAVADFRPDQCAENKIKKADGIGLIMHLERTRDILAELGSIPQEERPFLVGFAAESNDVRDNASGKLYRKHCNMLCCNDIKAPGCGFAVDTNQITIYYADGKITTLPMLSKMETASRIIRAIADEYERN
jgi:phosphopantothenoylcysteine decarboxylase / phosphopantothenate---cysteine ligase